jgi:spore coat protein SA
VLHDLTENFIDFTLKRAKKGMCEVKIAFISPDSLPVPPIRGGAVQLYIDEVIRRISKHHDITLFSSGDSNMTNPYDKNRIHLIRVDKANYIQDVSRKIQGAGFDIIHTFNRPHFMEYLMQSSPQSKFVLNLHNRMDENVKKYGKSWMKIVSKVDFFVANSHFTRKDTKRRFKIEGNKIRTVYLGVNPKKFLVKWRNPSSVEKLRKKWGVEDKKVVLFVGKINKNKGINALIEAGRILKNSHKNLLLLMVGGSNHGVEKENSEFYKFKKKAIKMLGKKHVRFTGFISPYKISQLYAIADVFVCPSLWKEPLGRVNLEAMASGLPIVATDRGGISEVVQHKKTGYLVSDPRDAKKLAKYIDKLLNDPSLCRKLGTSGYKLVIREFSWDAVVRKLNKIYKSLMKE